MNKVIILLVISDILILSAFGLVSPIFAIFLNGGIPGGSITAVGIAATVFFLVKSITQVPLSLYIDSKRSKLGCLWIGTALIVAVPFIYAFAPNIHIIYVAEGVYGFGAAMAYPAWFALFTRYVDKKHTSFEWSVWSTGVGLGTALTAYLGALTVESLGFDKLFYIVGFISLLGMISLLFLSNKYIEGIKDGVKDGFNKIEKVGTFLKQKHLKHARR
jgi:MFS family permease